MKISIVLEALTGTFETDMRRAARASERAAKDIENQWSAIGGKIAGGLGALAGVVSVGVFAGWIKEAIDAQDRADELGQKLGVTTEQMSKLQIAAKFAATDLEGVGKGVQKLAQNAAAAAAGTKSQVDLFKQIGVAVTDSNGKVRDSFDIFNDVAEKFASYEGGVNKTALAVKLFGKAGADLIPMFADWHTNVAEAIALGKEFGAIVTTEAGAGAARFNDTLAKMSIVAQGIGNQLATALLPALNDVADAAMRFFRSDQWKTTLATIVNVAHTVVDNLDAIAGAIKLIGELAVIWIAGKAVYAIGVFIVETIALTAQLATSAAMARELGIAGAAANAGMSTGIVGSIRQIGLLNVAVGGVTAAIAGWKIGEYLRENFLEANLLGIAFVEGMLVLWERIKLGANVAWEGVKLAALGAFDVILEGMASMLRQIAAAGDVEIMGTKLFGGMPEQITSLADSLSNALSPVDDFKGAVAGLSREYDANVESIRATTGALADQAIEADIAARAAKDAEKAVAGLGNTSGVTAPNIGELAEKTDKLAKAQYDLWKALSVQRGELDPSTAATEAYIQRITEANKKVAEWAEIGIKGADVVAYLRNEVELATRALDASAPGMKQLKAMLEGIAGAMDGSGGGSLQASIDDLDDLKARMNGASAAQVSFTRTMREATREYERAGGAKNKEALATYTRIAALAQEKLATDESIESLETIDRLLGELDQRSPFQRTIDQLEKLREELVKTGAPLEDIEAISKRINATMVQGFAEATAQALSSVQTLATEGTRSYEAIGLAIQAANIVAGIGAILNQGMGDPYTAIPRMVAMAAMVAQLVDGIGSFAGSGFSDTAARRQASQGTGTVLGDAAAKSESIANAVEITASATTELVGINRGMLNALRSLQSGLGAAATFLARGAGDADFSGMNLAVGTSYPLNAPQSIVDPLKILGGKSKITDQGIVIFGGMLTDLLENIAVGAYQEVQSRSWAFGSRRTRTGITDVSDEFGKQFELIMNSIADTVREGALALGLLPEEVQRAMEAYRVEEIKISLKGLSAEEQQAELAAVFSSIFDGLAGAVVPFIDQFQRVGEGLGETLVRVATGVQVTQEAVRYLGTAINETDPERFAQLSEGLIDAVGGIDALITGMQTFVQSFATDAHLLQVSTDELTSAFGQAGLKLPETADGMWALMQGLDATTEEGREQIATLLRLSSTARQYYDLLEKAEAARVEYAEKVAGLMLELGEQTEFQAAMAEVQKWVRETSDELNELARTAGRAGASEADLVRVHEVAAKRVAQLVAQLREQVTDLAVQLGYISQADTIESLNAQIASLGQGSADAADAIGSAVDSMRERMNLLLGDLSPFNDQQKLQMALEGLRAGTVDPQQVLEIGRRLYASTSNYTRLFNDVMGMTSGIGGFSGSTTPADESESTGDGRTLQELIAARDALLAAQRPELADQLARRLAELSGATGETFEELAESMGFSLSQIAEDLSLSDEQLQKYLAQLVDQFEVPNFAEAADLISRAIDTSRDAIVAAIQGKPVDDIIAAADQRTAAIASEQSAAEDERASKLAETIDSGFDRMISALASTSDRSTGEIVQVMNDSRRDMREAMLGDRSITPRRSPIRRDTVMP